MAVFSKQKQPDGQTSRFQRQIAFSLLSRTINLSAAGPSYFQQKQAQWPFCQREAQWPLYQSRSNRMARPLDFNSKLHFRYYPARSIYQRPGQAIFSKSKPNCRFIHARPNGRFTKAEAIGWPDLQISTTNCIFAIIPHDQFISGRAKLFSAKASLIAVLSTRGPMAVLSKQKQPDGQTSRFQRQIAFSLLSRTINLSAAGPSYFQQKQAQWPFYQREAQWPLYQSRSNRMARPLDFNSKLHFRYYPARSIYQRPDQAIFSKSKPNCRFIHARPNGRFTKAEAIGWPDLQISTTNCIFALIPHDQFISGRAKLFSAKSSLIAVLSTRGPMAVLSKQKQPDGQTSRFQRLGFGLAGQRPLCSTSKKWPGLAADKFLT